MSFPAIKAMAMADTPLAQQFAILRQLGVKIIDIERGTLDDIACFFLWANGLFSRVPFLSPNECYEIMRRIMADERIAKHIFCDGALLDNAAYRVGISDKRFVTTEFGRQFFDLKTAVVLATLPALPLEAVIYDLAELFRRNAKQCTQAANDELGEHPSVANGVGKP